jgi:large subunit ribosomal protein L21
MIEKKPVRTSRFETRATNTRTKAMFAVIKTGGKQYRVAAEDVLKVARVEAEPGAVVEFGEVLALGGDSPVVGTPTIAGATVAAEVLDHGRNRKVIAFKKRRRKNSRRKRGHRQEFSLVRITEILTEGRRPSETPPPRPRRSGRSAEAAADQSAAEVPPSEVAAAGMPAGTMPAAEAPGAGA